MILNIDLISENLFQSFYFKISDETIIDVKKNIEAKTNIKAKNQEWYFKNSKIGNNFILKEGNYIINALKLDNISFYLNYNNKTIKTPYVSKYIIVKELKDILSIKDNIYLKNKKLLDTKTLDYYNISNNTELKIFNPIFIKN